MAKRRDKGAERRIARERIEILMGLAEESALGTDMERADRYCDLARRIGMRYNVALTPRYRRSICKRCHRYLLPSVSSRSRLTGGKVSVRCLNCGETMRYPYIAERKRRRGNGSKGEEAP